MDGKSEKEESQGQKNSGQFLTHAPLTKTSQLNFSFKKRSHKPIKSNGGFN